MDDNALRALLGDIYDETTDAQRQAITEAADRIDARWPDPDLDPQRTDAMATALAVILGDDTLEEVGARHAAALAAYQDAQVALTGALIASAGEPETTLADRAGTTRPTVRKALGKA